MSQDHHHTIRRDLFLRVEAAQRANEQRLIDEKAARFEVASLTEPLRGSRVEGSVTTGGVFVTRQFRHGGDRAL